MTDVIRCASLETAVRVLRRLATIEPGVWIADPPSPATGVIKVRRVENEAVA